MSQKILIADTHVLCRDALCAYIAHANPSLSTYCVDDWSGLMDAFRKEGPDLVLIDHDFPLAEPVGPSMKAALMVQGHCADPMPHDDYYGIIPKYFSSKAILSGIQDILAGRTYFPSLRQAPEFPAVQRMENERGFDFGLTPRERDVLGYLVKGESNKAIARALDLQVVTVKLHVRGICRKLKAANRTQAALIARESGWR